MVTVAEYFDQRAKNWDAISDKPGIKHLNAAYMAGVTEGSRVLDLGCGTGIMTQAYFECGASEVVALDVSSEMISRAKDKFSQEPRVTFYAQDVLDYQDDRLFDVVVIYNAYPHFQDKPALVKKVATLLKPNGRFLVCHGMSRAALNDHHGVVPEEVTSHLLPVKVHAKDWTPAFAIDQLIDAGHMYAFGGVKTL